MAYLLRMEGLEIPLDLPDLWQQEAVRALREGQDVLVDAPTGAGKTRIFELFVESREATRRGQAVFAVPTRALANDKCREWRAKGWRVGIATGDVAEDVNAPVLVATLETQRERILARRAPAFLVVDEYQMLADPRRGLNYEIALALAPPETQLLLLSGSVRNPEEVAAWLERIGRRPRLILERLRPVPLEELPVENLPRVRGEGIGYWPRVAAGAILGGLTPLLIFAPRRAEAEKIARKIADFLPPDDPITLSPADERLLGREIAGLLQRRVAYHHSGLSYATRAGWIEPLAKNGHLRVIVATTGLAAGINFSVRSVLVADTKYQDGPYQREVRPDELLQMFGRAGRRGLDDKGFVLAAANSPSLAEGAPRQLRRVNELDWPTLIRVMEEAAARGESPIEAAASIGSRLFSRQRVSAGFEHSDSVEPAPERFGPTREEIFDSAGEWTPAKAAHEIEARLADCLALRGGKWIPALRVPVVAEKFGPGRLCKLREPGGFSYGKEMTVARRSGDGRLWPAEWIRQALHLGSDETFGDGEFMETLVPLLGSHFQNAVPQRLVDRGPMVALQLGLEEVRLRALADARQRPLLDPPRRRAAIAAETAYATKDVTFQPAFGTPAYAWRKLGLVAEDGSPTARGRIFSRFQGGEGLMIAAALEDESYELDELVKHLANLRGGHRFTDVGGASGRLAMATRGTYGHVDYEGYLQAGLCPGYGEGAWESIERHLSHGLAPEGDLRAGDIERAVLEWRSLLRHVVHAPDALAPRWEAFQQAASRCLGEREGRSALAPLVDLPPALRRRAVLRGVQFAGQGPRF